MAAVSILKRSVPILKKNIFYAPRGTCAGYLSSGAVFLFAGGNKKLARKHQAIFLKIDPDIPAKDPLWHEALKEKAFGVWKERGLKESSLNMFSLGYFS